MKQEAISRGKIRLPIISTVNTVPYLGIIRSDIGAALEEISASRSSWKHRECNSTLTRLPHVFIFPFPLVICLLKEALSSPLSSWSTPVYIKPPLESVLKVKVTSRRSRMYGCITRGILRGLASLRSQVKKIDEENHFHLKLLHSMILFFTPERNDNKHRPRITS